VGVGGGDLQGLVAASMMAVGLAGESVRQKRGSGWVLGGGGGGGKGVAGQAGKWRVGFGLDRD
jgi:hypothetical protein